MIPGPPYMQMAYLGLSLLGSFLILRWAIVKMDPNKDAKASVSLRLWYTTMLHS
jgi:hypothetical protein